jgi:nitroreductase
MLTDPGLIAGLAASGREAYRDWLSSIDSPAVRDGLADYGSNFFWFDAAPVLALSVIRRPPAFLMEAAGPEAELVWGGHLSAAMAIEAALLAAVALGLGGCCLGGPLAVGPEMGRFLGLGRRERLSLMAVFGYPKIVPG